MPLDFIHLPGIDADFPIRVPYATPSPRREPSPGSVAASPEQAAPTKPAPAHHTHGGQTERRIS